MILPRTLFAALLTLSGCVESGEVISLRANASHETLSVSAGAQHACAVIDRRAYCWGANDDGQLGIGTTQQIEPLAALVASDAHFTQIAAGSQHSCALDDLGDVYCWGSNQRGQLGLGHRETRLVPTRVALPAPATRIATKFRHSCALLLDASLYCWGDNEEGQIGQADPYPADAVTLADALNPLSVSGNDWRAVDTGDGHTCGVRTSGEIWCWGRNSDHELGTDVRMQVREPVLVTTERGWLSVSAGQNHTCALKQNRSLWCWGLNTANESGEGAPLGIPDAAELQEPTPVGVTTDWAQLDTNTFHTCALTRDNDLHCWGRNVEGQLGLADLALRVEPTFVRSGTAAVSAGRFATCALTDAAEVRCTGDNASGQLGTADYERRAEFSPLVFAN